MRKNISIVIALLGLLASSVCFSETVRFGIPLKHQSKLYAALHQIYSEAFSTLGMEFDSVPCVPAYCAVSVVQGAIDGEAARHGEYAELYPQLMRIELVLFELTTVAITRQSRSTISSLEEVGDCDCKVGYQQGYRAYENTLSRLIDKNNLSAVSHWEDGLDRLRSEEIDIYFAVEQILGSDGKSSTLPDLKMHPIDDYVIRLYPFVGKAFKQYSDPLREQLTTMKHRGRIREILMQNDIPVRGL